MPHPLLDRILAAEDYAAGGTPVEIPEWGITSEHGARLIPMTGFNRARIEEISSKASGGGGHDLDFRTKVIAWSLVDPDGARIIGDGDIPKLRERNGVVLDRLFDAALKVNKMDKKSLEEAAGN
ncbi:MAG: hypothetical protein KDA21_15700 [Phycisphaerales bacterium]|nr:hypothetical protein [Phycisphaerales bacterium]